MKNVLKLYLAAILSIGFVPPALAQVMGDAAVAVATSAQNQAQMQQQAAQVQGQVTKLEDAAAATPAAIAAQQAAPQIAAPAPAMPGNELPQLGGIAPEEELAGDKVPASVKSIVKRLDAATEDVTLEDLNSAREAVAKLDVLIDIEKRLSDLTTIRQKREEGSMLGGAIPASALGMIGNGMPAMPQPQPVAMPLTLPEASVDIVRIVGASGHRVVFIKSDGDKTIQVREGDKLSDDSIVTDISSHGMTLLKEGKKRTVKVKDVGTIFTSR